MIKTNNITFEGVPTPCYVMEESLLRKNLSLIRSVMDRTGVEIILAFKSFALWKSFPVFRETTLSGSGRKRLASGNDRS